MTKTYTAADIVPLFIEFRALVRDKGKWNEDNLMNNLPRLIRYRRLMSMLSAFGLKCDLEDFENGYFMYKKNRLFGSYEPSEETKNNQLLNDEIQKFLLNTKRKYIKDNRYLDYLLLWRYLLNLAERILHFKDDSFVKRGNKVGAFYLDILENFYTPDFNEKVDKVFNLLGIIIDPMQKSITEDELINIYKYPVDDLERIDGEWY